ncbi:IS30 family transposase [Ruminococcus sp.]|uniref:IS30 family transposase n=1 Tax=Ruminococcus sp. TaxID=41978 RepID=UPI0025F9874F|nr:IS30 family transposase [Ruminococcus sp.]
MGKHLSLDDRSAIQVGLDQSKSFREIAGELNKAPSSISREVRNHIVFERKAAYGRCLNECVHRHDCRHKGICEDKPHCVSKNCRFCKECNGICTDFEREVCSKLSSPPYVCNGCSDRPKCTLEKRFYNARSADKEYRAVLSESREGFNLTEEEFLAIDAVASEAIDRGVSVYNITHQTKDSLTCSESTLYRLIHSGTLTARTLDLPRAVKFKVRKGMKKTIKVDRKCTENRTYDDFLKFKAENPDTLVTEMDSVEGKKGGKVLLTLMIPNCSFMLAFIRDHNTSQSVIDVFKHLYKVLPNCTYEALFSVLLTDNGTEFSNPSAIEFIDGIKRSSVFYCEPFASYEKPRVENNHMLIRRVLPKGTSFDNLSQDDIDLMMSHINSYPRKMLNGYSPTQMFIKYYGKRALRLLRQELIPNEYILLKPKLLKK